MAAPMMMSESVGTDAGFDLAPGETLVPGSVQTLAPAEGAEAADAAVESARDAAGAAPPVPQPDADTDI